MGAARQPRYRAPLLVRHGPRITVSLIPLVFALLHAINSLSWNVLHRFDEIIYDVRLLATMPRTLDERVAIVDIDEKSLAQVGQWPWPRDRMAQLVDELYARQHASLLGFDMVFAEADHSGGLPQLRALANNELRDDEAFLAQLHRLEPELNHDQRFAQALQGRPVVLGYYFTGDRNGRTNGQLPAPVMASDALRGRIVRMTSWNGYGANIAQLAQAAPHAGFFNAVPDNDGVVRSTPLVAEYRGDYYESLSLAMFRRLAGDPLVTPGFPHERLVPLDYGRLESIRLQHGNQTLRIPVDSKVASLVPFRGNGGSAGGSYRYYSASDIVNGRLPPDTLRGKIVLIGTTAPGLMDLRITPVGGDYPGVEVHANLISGMLDGKLPVRPDYTMGFEVVVLLLAGLVLALGLPMLSAMQALTLSMSVVTTLVGLNLWLYISYQLVLPLAPALVMTLITFALNMSYGYLVESRSKRELANLFGTYVPPELVDEMVKNPERYSMQATERELTVMFCDMRGFTRLSEGMEPTQLQTLLNTVFSRLTHLISAERGTVDKYMGDCVMAFWGAPVATPDHARLAVATALQMTQEVDAINRENRARGLPEIGVGIGLHTGLMCVGDMGSDVRRSYTVIGDAVNLGSRLEGLSKVYGTSLIVSEATRRQAPGFVWQELDRVRVKGREQAVTIYTPIATGSQVPADKATEFVAWQGLLRAYRAQDWERCDVFLMNLMRLNANYCLYQLYARRLASRRTQPVDPTWDGTTDFETK